MKSKILTIDTTMRKYILVLMTPLMAAVMQAQTLTPELETEFYKKAFDRIVEYERTGYVGYDSDTNDSNLEKFGLCFQDENVYVPNDLMGLALDEDSITVYKYLQLLRKTHRFQQTVYNLKKASDIVTEDTVWQMKVTFDKSVKIETPDFVCFDSKHFFQGKLYKMTATLVMEKTDERRCYIKNMSTIGEYLAFPSDYRILNIKEYDKRDKNLYINNVQKIDPNDCLQYILRPNEKVYYLRGLVDLVPTDAGGRKYMADYKDKSWRIRANGAFSLSDFNRVDGLTVTDDSEKSFGIDLGYVFRTGSKLHTGVFVGFGISMNEVKLTDTNILDDNDNHEVDNKLDDDDETYFRHYRVWGEKGVSQIMDEKDITIPLYADLEYQFNAFFSAYADLGLRLQTSSKKWKAEIDEYEVWGVYPTYGNLTIRNYDEKRNEKPNKVVLNDFGMHKSIEGEDYFDITGTTNKNAIDVMLGLGVRLNLTKSFALDAGLQYVHGLRKSWKVDGGADNHQVFSYDGKKDMVNLLRKTDGIKHRTFRLTYSLIFKF